MKKKIKKSTLLSYFDSELSEHDSEFIKDLLIENEEATNFLEDMAVIENSYKKIDDLHIDDTKKDEILNSAFNLMDKKVAVKKQKIKRHTDLKNLLQTINPINTFNNFAWGFKYGYMALTILIAIIITFSRGELIPNNFEVINLNPQIFTNNINNDNTGDTL